MLRTCQLTQIQRARKIFAIILTNIVATTDRFQQCKSSIEIQFAIALDELELSGCQL